MINKVILVGFLGRDPEMRYTQNGRAMATFSVATTEKWRKDGQQQEQTEWHNVVAWERLAEICGQYLRKGSKVYIEGKLQTSQWQQDGQTRYRTQIVARELKMLDNRQSSQGYQNQYRQPAPPPRPAQNYSGNYSNENQPEYDEPPF